MKLLPFERVADRLEIDLRERTITPLRGVRGSREAATVYDYDVAVSFSGTERQFAHELATRLQEPGFTVFYDDFYPEALWGKDLVVAFNEIYKKRARYCVVFVSKEYNNGPWTVHERRSAQERMLQERGSEYILPIKVNDVELPGMPSTIGYLSLEKYGIERIAEILIKKLAG
jgi:hypothetical protein